MGRFINADTYTSTGQGLVGNNMFAYCGNNPVIFHDPTGNIFCPYMLHTNDGGGGKPTDLTTWPKVSSGIEKKGIDTLLDYIFNDDESDVLNSTHFSFYKGVPVIKMDWDFANGRSGSLGVIFLHEDEKRSNIVKHEYGHCLQLALVGPIAYLSGVFIPSAASGFAKLSDKGYYSTPWDYPANILGGVTSDSYYGGSGIAALVYTLYLIILPI